MKEIREIESLVLSTFAFLKNDFGFGKPILNRGKWNTTVSYLAKEIGVEIEIDWRELEVFILITNLYEGKLPGGYYMHRGRLCRIHLEEILQNKLKVQGEYIKRILKFGKKKNQKRDQEHLQAKIASYQKILYAYVGAICDAGESLFYNDETH